MSIAAYGSGPYVPRGVAARGVNTLGWAAASGVGAMSAFVIALLLAGLEGMGRWAFCSAMVMVFCIDSFLWFAFISKQKRFFAMQAGFVVMWIRSVLPIGMCFVLPLGEDHRFPWGEYLFEAPFSAAGGVLISPLVIATLLLLIKPFMDPGRAHETFRNVVRRASPRMEMFLLLAAFMNFTYWFTVLLPNNPLFYAMRVLNTAMNFAPFLAGYAAFKFKRATIAWLAVLGVGLVFATLTGGRGAAFVPITYFILGFLIGLPDMRARIRYTLTLVLPCCLALLMLGVYIGVVRDVVGRTDLMGLFKKGSIFERADDTFSAMEMEGGFQEGVGYKAFQRLTSWPNLVIPTMTPDPVPHRGYDDFMIEFKAAFNLGILRGNLYSGGIYFANWFLKPYGFAVHATARSKTSNVEFPTVADGYTRGGWAGAIAAAFVAYCAFMIVELILRRHFIRKNPILFIFLTVTLMEITIQRVNNETVVDALRSMCLYVGFATVCFYLFDRALSYLGVRR